MKAHNSTAHHILTNEIDFILIKLYGGQKSTRGIFSAIISHFIGLVCKDNSSFLHHKRHNALHKAVKAMLVTMDMQRNKLMHLENTLVMYRIYNAETLENLIKTVHALTADSHYMKVFFTGKTLAAYESYLQMYGSCGIQHYAVNSM